MTGKHEPPSRTTFYLSLATGALRAALVAAALVVGVFVLSRAFPQAEAPTPQSTAAPRTPSPEPDESPTEEQETTPSPEQPSPRVEGVRLAVLNGTQETGLAAQAAQTLQELGYRVEEEDVGNAQGSYETTTLFFRPNFRREAAHLRNTVFEGARLDRATDQLDAQVRITVVLGQDWADRN